MPTESPSPDLRREAGQRTLRSSAPRVRQRARDAVATAGISLVGSVVVVVAVWAVVTWFN